MWRYTGGDDRGRPAPLRSLCLQSSDYIEHARARASLRSRDCDRDALCCRPREADRRTRTILAVVENKHHIPATDDMTCASTPASIQRIDMGHAVADLYDNNLLDSYNPFAL